MPDRSTFSVILSEPLVHFLVIGGLLYLLFVTTNGDALDVGRIRVDESRLASHLASLDPRIDEAQARARLDEMPASGRELLVEKYIRHEVLYREALRLGLDVAGYAEERRLINRLNYVNDAYWRDRDTVPETDLKRWFDTHRERYQEAARVSFVHVYLGGEQAGARAIQLLAEFNDNQTDAADALRYGDRFIYNRSYVDRTQDEMADYFGEAFARRLFSLPSGTDRWHGPIESSLGVHLVKLRDHHPASTPSFENVRRVVAEDYQQARLEEARQQFYERARARYEIHIASP